MGATKQQIVEATAVAVALKGGCSDWAARFVFKVMDELEQENKK